MAIAIDRPQDTDCTQADTVLVEKVRWSLRQRLRRQLHLLCNDFFDEVDDFLFSSGQQGPFSKDDVYLNAMREIRAKQAHFDSLFLDAVIDDVKESASGGAMAPDRLPGADTRIAAVMYERVEVDLALQAMVRKGVKAYLPVMRQIDSIQDRLQASLGARIIGNRIVLDAVLSAFASTHTVFNMPLEIRLMVIKLFERYVVLKLEKVFLDIISIISNVSDPEFVDKLYSSSSAMRTRTDSDRLKLHQSTAPQATTGGNKPAVVQAAVDRLIDGLCDDNDLPAFIVFMLREQWRSVMFLIGLNKGTLSVEWGEARHTAQLLAMSIRAGIRLNETEQASLIDHLGQGFSLIRLPCGQREEFFLDLDQHLHSDERGIENAEKTVISPPGAPGKALEASVSPAGTAFLDQQDLDEIARMLGGDNTPSHSRQLADLLRQVDALPGTSTVDFMLGGEYVRCLLQRSAGNTELFTVSRQGAQVSVTRSRLGLALALQSGELRLTFAQYGPGPYSD